MTEFLRAPLRALPAEPGCVIDCDTCTVRGDACADCVVSVMLGGPPDAVAPDEQRALGVLAGLGLVPPLQMTPAAGEEPGRPPGAAGGVRGRRRRGASGLIEPNATRYPLPGSVRLAARPGGGTEHRRVPGGAS